jgi:hypothetical protein
LAEQIELISEIEVVLFRITNHIWLGRFASVHLLPSLKQSGITHIVNVSEASNQLREVDGPFQKVAWVPIEDLSAIPLSEATRCLDVLHDCVCEPNSNVYLHCIAGLNRSPTILWLYFLACGIESGRAKKLITDVSFDAAPGHSQLINTSIIETARQHGLDHFQPHPRPIAIDSSQLEKSGH